MLIGHSHPLIISRIELDTLWLAIENKSDHAYPSHAQPTDVALPRKQAPHASVGDIIDVFVYTDSQANACATVRMPYVRLGQCACLAVSTVTEAGAFLDWGIEKDLLLPYAEQRRPVTQGLRESVLVYLDNSGRLAASSRLDHHLSDQPAGFKQGQPVSLLAFQRTDLGFKAVIDHCAIGLIYKDEIFQPLRVGQTVAGFVKQLRADGRLDLTLQLPGRDQRDDLNAQIMQYLAIHEGVSTLTDKSPPETIYAAFHVSKKMYKKALGNLYRQRRIIIADDKITLPSKAD